MRRILFGLWACVATSAMLAQTAAGPPVVRLPRVFSDGMVLQRGVRIPVWGWTTPRTAMAVTLNGQSARVQSDSAGAWRVELPAMPAGGPFEMRVTGAGERVVIRDVLIGDVWVASGQSNMEWKVADANNASREIAAAHDGRLRQFKVPTAWSWKPEDDVTGGQWVPADSQHVGNFTAVGYFFARELRTSVGVPIGIVNTTWGGSGITPWISRSAQKLDNAKWEAVQQSELNYQNAIRTTLLAKLGTLSTVDSGMAGGTARWADPSFDDANWPTLSVPGAWERMGYAGLDGVAWYRTSFTLTDAEAQQAARVGVGAVDDADITWINGVEVGRTAVYGIPREYNVPSRTLKGGRNVLVVRVTDGGGEGGIIGTPQQVFLEIGGARKPLGGTWRFKVATVSLSEDGQHVNKIPAILYNRMVRPLLPFPIKGVIWYQGESNANNDAQALAYRDEFATLIQSWRQEWGGGRAAFPFLWVQLPNFGSVDNAPPSSAAWATMRESQTSALALPRTGQAVTIDVGDTGNIHPRNKQDVGHRLALVARSVAYGQAVEFSGPAYKSHRVRNGRVEVSFAHLGGGLVSRNAGDSVAGFAIAGEDGRYVWATARIEGNVVAVWNKDVPAPRAVRYAWGNSPRAASLYNRAGLPAAPFRTPLTRWVGTWEAAQQLTETRNLPPAPGLSGNTLRQMVHVSIGGSRIRVRFANLFGEAPVVINAVHIAIPGAGSAIRKETDRAILFGGKPGISIAPGTMVMADAMDFPVAPLSELAVTIHFGSTPQNVTGHPGSRTTSYLQSGNHVTDADMPDAVRTEHWYMLANIDVTVDDAASAVTILGNSITDGRGSGTDRNNRWPDELSRRLQEDARTARIAVLNAGLGGNAVVRGGLGPPAVDRFVRDVLEPPGVRWLIVFEGVNDIGGARGADASATVARELIAAYERIVAEAHKRNIRVLGATIMPFGGSQYDSPEHEASRQTVNAWIRTSGVFDGVVDFDAALRDPAAPTRLLPIADSGDHLHPSERGHRMMAEVVDLRAFVP